MTHTEVLYQLAMASHRRPVTARVIARALEISECYVRSVIHTLRHDGHLVCSDHRGYWLAVTADDVEETARRLSARAQTIARTVRAMRRAHRVAA